VVENPEIQSLGLGNPEKLEMMTLNRKIFSDFIASTLKRI